MAEGYHDSSLVDKAYPSTYNRGTMKKPKTKKPVEIDETIVRLKPIFGVQPPVYLLYFYIFLLVLIIFFLLFFPGIFRNGSQVTFTSSPPGVSVYVDDIRVGSTPVTAFVASGNRHIRFSKGGFDSSVWEEKVPGRLFFSLFVPKKVKISNSIVLTNKTALLEKSASEFASWAMIGESNERYQFPLVLSEAVLDVSSNTAVPDAETGDFLAAMIGNVVSPALLKDYIRAYALYCGNGAALSPASIDRLLQFFIQLHQESSVVAFWLANTLPRDIAEEIAGSGWFEGYYGSYMNGLAEQSSNLTTKPGSPVPPQVEVNGMDFTYIPGGSFLMGIDPETGNSSNSDPYLFPGVKTVDEYYIKAAEVTQAEYAAFLNANPEWRAENIDALVENGLVTEDYLAGFGEITDIESSTLPVSGVSYYAAEAFCVWLESKLPPSLAGYRVRLPSETEWERAAAINNSSETDAVFFESGKNGPSDVYRSGIGSLGLYGMQGNVWEWCENWFFPAEYAFNHTVEEDWPTSERTVRGGSWANESDSVNIATRGSQPPSWCTPFLGFRVVLSGNS